MKELRENRESIGDISLNGLISLLNVQVIYPSVSINSRFMWLNLILLGCYASINIDYRLGLSNQLSTTHYSFTNKALANIVLIDRVPFPLCLVGMQLFETNRNVSFYLCL